MDSTSDRQVILIMRISLFYLLTVPKVSMAPVLLSLYCKQIKKKLIAINNLGSTFSAELSAILWALHWLAINRPRKSLFVTDCYSVSQALNSKKCDKHYILDKIL